MCSAWISDQDWLIRFPSGSRLLYVGGETLAGRTDWEQAAEKRDVGDVERLVVAPGYLAWSKERAGSAKKAGVPHNTARKYLRQADPSKQKKQPHDWRTRKGPLEAVAEFAVDCARHSAPPPGVL